MKEKSIKQRVNFIEEREIHSTGKKKKLSIMTHIEERY